MIDCRRYEVGMEADWNRLVRAGRNGTFLLDRGFMDYHADRFTDASRVFFRKDAPVALLPLSLHAEGSEWRSHGGLTYGGLILDDRATILDVMEMFERLAEAARAERVASLLYKPAPWIYHRYPAEEDRHALFHHGATLEASELDTVIDLAAALPMSRLRRRGAKKARAAGMTLDPTCAVADFHPILSANLGMRHDTRPVHSVTEMAQLQDRFPENIALWGVRSDDGALKAGAWIFDCGYCAHSQYIASTQEGRDAGAVDLLFEGVLAHFSQSARYFSFGISNEDGGRRLNEGLFRQKTMFGGRGIVYETHRIRF